MQRNGRSFGGLVVGEELKTKEPARTLPVSVNYTV
jgi:hypothetical protein